MGSFPWVCYVRYSFTFSFVLSSIVVYFLMTACCGILIYWWYINPIDPNPAVAAHAVFPQSGRSRPEKQPFFHIFPKFSQIEPSKKYLPHIEIQYIKLKLMKCWFRCKRNHIVLINRYALVGLWTLERERERDR